jgi:hypothetical protein
MNASLRMFIYQYAGVVLAALVPVIFTAFLSIPYSLGGHPGDARTSAASSSTARPSELLPHRAAPGSAWASTWC